MEEDHHRDGGVYAFDLVTRSNTGKRRMTMNTHEFGCLSKVVIAYCGRNELPRLSCLRRNQTRIRGARDVLTYERICWLDCTRYG